MAHNKAVSKAIQAALSDIHLLRLLVNAAGEDAANNILTAYRRDLKLSGPDVTAFYTSLRTGKKVVTAKMLVEYYNNLEPKPRTARGGAESEWTP